MSSGTPRFSKYALNRIFVDALGNSVKWIGKIDEKPLLIDIAIPHLVRLRAYLYNCTNPPGGRKSNEYKSQIIVPGQNRGERGNFDFSDDRIVILGAYAKLIEQSEDGVFVFWDTMRHANFSYSANIQVKSELLIAALAKPVCEGKKTNGEIILTAKPEFLLNAIKRRIEIVSPLL